MDPFPALADPVRRALLVRLATDGPTRVVDLHGDHAVSRPAVSRHLRVLHEAGLVTAVDRGRERWYSLLPDGLVPVQDWLATVGSRPPVGAVDLDALDLEVRRTVREGGTRSTTDTTTHQEDTA